MSYRRFFELLGLSLVVTACDGTESNTEPVPHDVTDIDQALVDRTLEDWPANPRQSATMLISKYGLPNEVTQTMLVWHQNGAWKRTILHRDEIQHDFPKPHTDYLEQFIDYRVPLDRYDELATYDGSVIVERTKGEISARCDKEELNLLALNLANDVATGARSVEEAREFYAMTAAAFLSGELRPYTERLQFTPTPGSSDPDQPFSPTP
jgi:hypothetical protein